MYLDRYGRHQNRMKRIHAEIEVKPDNITPAWNPRGLLSSTRMGNILADEDKHNPSTKITVTNAEDKGRLVKNGLWFGGK